MLLKKIIEILERLDPPEDYQDSKLNGFNVGPLRGLSEKVVKKGVLICHEPTIKAIDIARMKKYNLIISREPLLKELSMNIDENISNKIFLLNQNHIMLYKLGANWDEQNEGANEVLGNFLGLKVLDKFFYKSNGIEVIKGRICHYISNGSDDKLNFLKNLKRILSLDNLNYYINEKRHDIFDKILVFAGHCSDIVLIKSAISQDISCIICGTFSYECKILAYEYGISLIELTYEISFKPGLEKLNLILSTECPNIEIDYLPAEIILKIL